MGMWRGEVVTDEWDGGETDLKNITAKNESLCVVTPCDDAVDIYIITWRWAYLDGGSGNTLGGTLDLEVGNDVGNLSE